MARIFRGTGAAKLTAAQKAWIADGGILFYSLYPGEKNDFTEWAAACCCRLPHRPVDRPCTSPFASQCPHKASSATAL